MLLASTEKLLRETKTALEQEILCLENSDERLATNGNGNLPRYESLKQQLWNTEAQITAIDRAKMTPEQINNEARAKAVRAKLATLQSSRWKVISAIERIRYLEKNNPSTLPLSIATNEFKEAFQAYRQMQRGV